MSGPWAREGAPGALGSAPHADRKPSPGRGRFVAAYAICAVVNQEGVDTDQALGKAIPAHEEDLRCYLGRWRRKRSRLRLAARLLEVLGSRLRGQAGEACQTPAIPSPLSLCSRGPRAWTTSIRLASCTGTGEPLRC